MYCTSIKWELSQLFAEPFKSDLQRTVSEIRPSKEVQFFFNQSLVELKTDLVDRAYHTKMIDSAFTKVKAIPREEALKKVKRRSMKEKFWAYSTIQAFQVFQR